MLFKMLFKLVDAPFCLTAARMRRKAKAITVEWICPIFMMFTLLAISMAIDEEEIDIEVQAINRENFFSNSNID
jgi:heterodisulfide reductase subunit B